MKIVFLATKYAFSGGEKVLRLLIKGMSLKGHEVIVYTWDETWKEKEEELNIKVKLFQTSLEGIYGKIKSIIKITRSIKIDNPDCIIVFSLYLAELGIFSSLITRTPLIVSERIDPRFFPEEKIHRILRFLVYLLSKKIVFQTEENMGLYPHIIRKKGTVIDNPIETSTIKIRETTVLKKEIIGVGRLSDEKNFKLLINSFVDAGLIDYKLRIFGDGPLKDDLLELIRTKNVKDLVSIEGHNSSMPNIMQQSDIYVLSSNHEGVPNALLESMSYGMACIATDVPSGGSRRLIKNEVNGLLISVNNQEELSNAINKLANDRELNFKLRNNARNIIPNHSENLITLKWLDVVKSTNQHLHK